MPSSLPLCLLIPSLKRNPRVGLTVAHPEIGGLGVQSMFNKNIIKPKNNKEYIEEATNTIAILYTKQGYNYKGDVLAHLKISLNQTTKIKPTKVIKLLHS